MNASRSLFAMTLIARATISFAQSDPAPPDWLLHPPPFTELVTVENIPTVKYDAPPALTEQEHAEIKSLIDDLTQLSDPTLGLSGTLTGVGFAPIPNLGSFYAGLLTDHKLQNAPAFARLVALGPRALPQLLKSLGDNRPTRRRITHDYLMGIMSFEREISGNPRHDQEWKAISSFAEPARESTQPEHVKNYDVTVGDVCFVVIGQIVGRPYLAVRYQPTACIILNSPTHDPKFANAVVEAWSTPDASRGLLDSLLIDFYSRGKTNDIGSLDLWSCGAQFQTPAATRLLYYFPEIGAPLIAARLDTLDVKTPKAQGKSELNAFMDQTVANGVRVDEFIQAVSWSNHPEIRAALVRIAERTDDSELKRLCAPPNTEAPK